MADTVYTSRTRSTQEQPAALVVSCSMGELQPHVREFAADHLKLADGTFDYLAVPGGPHFLLLTEYLPKFAWAGQRWIKFLVTKHGLKKIVLVSHQDCAWCKDERIIPALVHKLLSTNDPRSLMERQIEDLQTMARSVHALLPAVAVEGYFARYAQDRKMEFLRVV